MRIVFMGSPDFSVGVLDALVTAGHDVCAVYSQPPRPAGRGHKETPCPVHRRAEEHGIPVRTPKSLKSSEEQAACAALDADVAVVAAYGLILPRAVLDAPRHGCLNVHASLLPRWRGAAPIQRAIMEGDSETGVTIMQMETGLDTGPMLLREAVPIDGQTTAGSLHDTLAVLGARLMVETLERLPALTAEPQPEEGVTYAAKIDKAEAKIDWTRPAAAVARHINGLSPFPGAWFTLEDQRIKALLAEAGPAASAAPGTLIDDAGAVACGNGGSVRLLRLQRAGKGPMDRDTFVRGRPLPKGTVLA